MGRYTPSILLTVGGLCAFIAFAWACQSCEVGRSEAWRESRSVQTQACAESCWGSFTVHWDSTEAFRCECAELWPNEETELHPPYPPLIDD